MVIESFLVSLFGALVVIGIPTAIIYWRNGGKLSPMKSYYKALLYYFRFFGWASIVVGVIFVPLIIGDLVGLTHWGYPWWSGIIILVFIGVGYGVQRVARFVLNDPDWNNMFASKDK